MAQNSGHNPQQPSLEIVPEGNCSLSHSVRPPFEIILDDTCAIPADIKPPFEIVLDDSCSISYDDLPVNCTIRVMPVEGRSPPRISPGSHWMKDYGHHFQTEPGQSTRFHDELPCEHEYGPLFRDKHGKIVGSPICPPSRSRRSIVESVKRNIRDNAIHSSYHCQNANSNEASPSSNSSSSYPSTSSITRERFDDEVFCCRMEPNSRYPTKHAHTREPNSPSHSPEIPSQASPSSDSSNTPADRLINLNRPNKSFRRKNITIDINDNREMQSPDSKSMPTSPASPPSKRCCAMADSEGVKYRSSGETRTAGVCTYHGSQPCPVRAGSFCRQNHGCPSANDAANESGKGGQPEPARICKYHHRLSCPVLAGVECRGERQMSGVPSPSSSLASSRSQSPNRSQSPMQDSRVTSQHSPLRSGSPSRGGGGSPPSEISPPPTNPRSRSPGRRPG